MEHLAYGMEHWKSVVSTDEKQTNLDRPDGAKCFWHHLKKAPDLISKRQGWGQSAMV